MLEITDKNEIQNLILICKNDFQEVPNRYQCVADVVIDFHNGMFLTFMILHFHRFYMKIYIG